MGYDRAHASIGRLWRATNTRVLHTLFLFLASQSFHTKIVSKDKLKEQLKSVKKTWTILEARAGGDLPGIRGQIPGFCQRTASLFGPSRKKMKNIQNPREQKVKT